MPLFFYNSSMQTNMLRLSLAQTTLSWEDPKGNLAHFAHLLSTLQPGQTDVVILPEMFTTGFSMSPKGLAEPTEGRAYHWMAQEAARLSAVVAGSIMVEENGQYFNRLLWVRPDGSYAYYDKRHLFTLAGEQEHYSPGQKPLLVQWKGWAIMPLICYDLRFPVWSRNQYRYDLLLYVANWPAMRIAAWDALLRARAIENQAYTVGVNRIGDDGNGYPHCGHSSVYDYSGGCRLLVSESAGIFTLSLEKKEQDQFRSKLAFLNDQDAFEIL